MTPATKRLVTADAMLGGGTLSAIAYLLGMVSQRPPMVRGRVAPRALVLSDDLARARVTAIVCDGAMGTFVFTTREGRRGSATYPIVLGVDAAATVRKAVP